MAFFLYGNNVRPFGSIKKNIQWSNILYVGFNIYVTLYCYNNKILVRTVSYTVDPVDIKN